MKQRDIEDAVAALQHLLAQGASSEHEYQQFLETHSVVFELLGYERTWPRVELPRPAEGSLVPDFIGRRASRLYDIIEIKTPDVPLIKTTKNRESLYANMTEYVAQVAVYCEYFDDQANRERARAASGLDIQKRPDAILIVGRDTNVDHKQLHAIVGRHSMRLHVLTYDMLLSQMRMQCARLFGQSERLAGVSWHALLRVECIDEPRLKYIWDAGLSETHDRFSIYLDAQDSLCCEVVDSAGRQTRVTVRPGTAGYTLGAPIYVCCEFGNSDNYSALQVFVNNRLAAKSETAAHVPLSPNLKDGLMTVGQPIKLAKKGASFTLFEMLVHQRVLEFQERLRISGYLLSQLP